MEENIDNVMKERFKQLPEALQEAITSAEVEKLLRGLADQHRLHLDQWQILENEVIMTLLGLRAADELEEHIKKEVRTDEKTAQALARDIALKVFAPIRKELEEVLNRPSTLEAQLEPKAADETKEGQQKSRVKRAPTAGHYASGQLSAERKGIEGDPYREPLD